MNIDDLTIGQVKQLQKIFGSSDVTNGTSYPYQLNANYLIRTVTMTLYGRLIAVHEQELVLQDAAWIADTGRFSDTLGGDKFDEVEPFPDGEVIIGRGSIIDAVALTLRKLERVQK